VKATCSECGKTNDNVRLREKTDANFHVNRLPFCTPCARKDGWIDVTWERGYHHSLGHPPVINP
jgi:hypothetical protein